MPHPDEDSVDDVVGSLAILKTASDIAEFKEWLTQYHGLDNFNEIIKGYKFFIQTAVQKLFFGLHNDRGLNLGQDEQFNRAHAEGISLEDFPNSCEKAKFIKRIWVPVKNINREENWTEIDETMVNLNRLISSILDVITPNIEIKNGMKREEAIKWMTIEWLNIFFNDTIRGYPLGAITYDGHKLPLKDKYLDQVYSGFVLTLQFTYFKTLGDELFYQTNLTRLDRALEEWSGKKFPDGLKGTVHTQFGSFQLENMPLNIANRRFASNNLKRLVTSSRSIGMDWVEKKDDEVDEDITPSDKWLALDEMGETFLHQIKELDLRLKKLYSSIPNNIGFVGKLDIKPFLKDVTIPEPSYMTNKDDLSKMKRLDASLLWYDLDVLDTQGVYQFNGAISLVSLLKGYVALAKENGKDAVLSIRIFQHPEGMNDDFSYGVLMDVGGSMGIGDYSGWLIFFDCASNASEKMRMNLRQIESCIRDIESDVQLDLKTVVIEKELFKKYLVQRSISPVFDTMIIQDEIGESQQISLPELRKKSEDSFEGAKGKLFEYVFAAMLHKLNPEAQIETDFTIMDEQIDAAMSIGDRTTLYECKINVHEDELENTMATIVRKVNIAKQSKKNHIITSSIIVYLSISDKRKKYFEEHGIAVIDDYRNAICKDTKFFVGSRSSKKQILSILDFSVDSFFPFG
jgi:hypothetical protein